MYNNNNVQYNDIIIGISNPFTFSPFTVQCRKSCKLCTLIPDNSEVF